MNYAKESIGHRYRELLLERLTEYGFTEYMTPEKYQAYAAVRKTVSIRTGISMRSGGAMTADEFEKCVEMLDVVLPSKAQKIHDCSLLHDGTKITARKLGIIGINCRCDNCLYEIKGRRSDKDMCKLGIKSTYGCSCWRPLSDEAKEDTVDIVHCSECENAETGSDDCDAGKE